MRRSSLDFEGLNLVRYLNMRGATAVDNCVPVYLSGRTAKLSLTIPMVTF